MARQRRRVTPVPSSSPITIGNCEVVVEAKNFTLESNGDSVQISISKAAKLRISVVDKVNENGDADNRAAEKHGAYCFVVANPKNQDGKTKFLLEDVISLYMRELPEMNHAANTGKKSMFLERCVTKGKYCTLILKSISANQHGEVIAAVTYQIIPADAHYAEIPLAAVTSVSQQKGLGRLLYLELRKRLSRVGVQSIFCWGDKESEGFWLKLGFTAIGQVDAKGRAHRLPIKSGIRKALCFPGGSTLMVSHLLNDSSSESMELPTPCLPTKPLEQNSNNCEQRLSGESHHPSKEHNQRTKSSLDEDYLSKKNSAIGEVVNHGKEDSYRREGTKKRAWEASCTSLKSKKVKGIHSNNSQTGSQCPVRTSDRAIVNDLDEKCRLYNSEDLATNLGSTSMHEKNKECGAVIVKKTDSSCPEIKATAENYRIMLMDIADDNKKSYLTKIIQDLGGVVASEGNVITHIITRQVRRTLNFCIGLCSGAWVVTSEWLKESFRNGRFVDEAPFILRDENYTSKYGTELKCAVLRAKACPNALLKGFYLCFATHVLPPASALAAIVRYAGGYVIRAQDEIKVPSKTIFIACEEDTEEALLAVRQGISKTFTSDWLMNCIMKQELDIEAPQFAESL